MSTPPNTPPDDGRPPAVVAAERAAELWADAVRLQRWADADHADFYALAGEIVATLYALDDLAAVLGSQLAGYASAQAKHGRAVYDDTRQIDPVERLEFATLAIGEMRVLASWATAWANTFWSAIGHIGTEDAPEATTEDDPSSGPDAGITTGGGPDRAASSVDGATS